MFFIHKDLIVTWDRHLKRLVRVSNTNSYHFSKISDHEYLFRCDFDQINHEKEYEQLFAIKKLMVQFGTYKVMPVYEERYLEEEPV